MSHSNIKPKMQPERGEIQKRQATTVYELLADAEAAEDAIEKVVRIDGTGHLAELFQCQANFQCQEFSGIIIESIGMGLAEVFDAIIDMVLAAGQTGSKSRPAMIASALHEQIA